MKIKKGDTVQVISGKDKGKSGKVLKMLSDAGRILVEGINVYKKHVKPKKQGQKGELISLARPISYSNVLLLCSSCRKGVRIGCRMDEDKKTRICRGCQSII